MLTQDKDVEQLLQTALAGLRGRDATMQQFNSKANVRPGCTRSCDAAFAVKEIKVFIEEFRWAKISLENLGSSRIKPEHLMDHFGFTLGEAQNQREAQVHY